MGQRSLSSNSGLETVANLALSTNFRMPQDMVVVGLPSAENGSTLDVVFANPWKRSGTVGTLT